MFCLRINGINGSTCMLFSGAHCCPISRTDAVLAKFYLSLGRCGGMNTLMIRDSIYCAFYISFENSVSYVYQLLLALSFLAHLQNTSCHSVAQLFYIQCLKWLFRAVQFHSMYPISNQVITYNYAIICQGVRAQIKASRGPARSGPHQAQKHTKSPIFTAHFVFQFVHLTN